MIRAYYNEIDDYCCAWLSNLMDAGIITPGKIDDKSIEDVCPDELMGYSRVHMYAGIGIWDYALNQAGWGDGEVWTASCPCQPFSAAGKGNGFADERHLWPASFHLIAERKPATIFGEQVASKAVEPWIDLVHADLEAMGYAFGCVAFPSASVGSPHIRDRTYWVADSISNGSQGRLSRWQDSQREIQYGQTGRNGAIGGLGNASSDGRERIGQGGKIEEGRQPQSECTGKLPNGFERHGIAGGMADTHINGRIQGIETATATRYGNPAYTNGFWSEADWVECRDGKLRPIESGTFPLVNGNSSNVGRVRADQKRISALLPRKDQGSRSGRLKGYGNAINAQTAKEFITAYMEI